MIQIRLVAFIMILLSLFSCVSHHINIPEGYLEFSQSRALLIDETIGNNRLLVYSFGSPPLLLKHRCIMGSGLDILIINRIAEKTVFTYSQGEIEGDLIVDYSDAESGVFSFTDCTCDPREEEETPFLLTTVTVLKNGSVSTSETILLKPEEGDRKRIIQLRDDALEAAQKESDEVESILGHLRNIGIKDPDNVLEAFASLYGKLGCGGGELLSMYQDEVYSARMLKSQAGSVPEE